ADPAWREHQSQHAGTRRRHADHSTARHYESVWIWPYTTHTDQEAQSIGMPYATIQFHPGPRVATIVLNRPPLNIINLDMMDDLNSAWDEVDAMESQVVVISGAGE